MGIVKRECQGDEYTACMEAVASLKTVIDRLPQQSQNRFTWAKQKADQLHARADRSMQVEERQKVEMERIKLKVGQGDLEDAIGLIDAILSQDLLSPNFKSQLLRQREKIEQLK